MSRRTMRAESGSILLNSERSVVRTSTANAAAISTPVGPAPTRTNVRRSACRLGSSSVSPCSSGHGVGQALQPGREAFELIVPEVTVPLAGCEDEIVVWDLHLRAIRRV